MAASTDVERNPEFSDPELAAALKGKNERLGRMSALKELSQRRSGRRTALLSEVVTDPDQPAAVRAAAALDLGRERKPKHQDALVTALDAPEPSVIRRAAEALGRVGDERALESLESVKPRGAPARQSVQFAKTLISYRHGLESNHLRKPPEKELLGSMGMPGAPLAVEKLAAADAARLLPEVERELPGTPVSPDPAFRFLCDESEFVLLFSREAVRRKTLAIGDKAAIPAVVVKRSSGLDRYYLYEYLLTHPRADGTLQLFGMRSVGLMIHAGELRLEGNVAHFELRALDRPGAPPVHVAGTYDHGEGTLAMSLATGLRTGASRRNPPGEPTKIDPPIG